MMSEQPTITIIGAGTMAEAIIAGLLRKGLTIPQNIRASDPRIDRGEELESRYGLTVLSDNNEAIIGADVIVLSVKPQTLNKVMAELNDKVPSGSLVLSIVAGVSIEMISKSLNHAGVVRSMPNTPAQIGEGITVWCASPSVTGDQKQLTKDILNAFGQEVYVEHDEENYLDMATALSGSGPAYIFLFMEAMVDAGVHLGFPRRIADQLVTQTMRGSIEYYDKMNEHAAHLRNQVTSPGGTSAAALYYLEKAGIRTAISRAIWAAYMRSQELGAGKVSKPPEND